MSHARAGRLPLLLCAVLAFAACGDSDPTDTVPLDFDPWETAIGVDRVLSAVIANRNAFSGLVAAGNALADYTDAETTVNVLAFRPGLDRAPGASLVTAERDAWTAPVVVPGEILGKTLVWDTEAGGYVVDDALVGAPADGFRVIHYEMDTSLHRPWEPLEPLGHIDVIDEDTDVDERLRLRVVDESGEATVEALNYVVTFTGDLTEAEGEMTLTAAGTSRSSEGTVLFDLTETYVWSQSADSETVVGSYGYALEDGTEIVVGFDGSAGFEASSYDEAAVRADVDNEGDLVEFDVIVAANNAVTGGVDLNGTPMILITGTGGPQTFTHVDGGSLSFQDWNALNELWALILDVMDVSTLWVISPSGLLLLPG